ncbi:hypothetical protein [Roseospirillum parvum]|uniref:Lipoprotein n=1 Tax=Roseospirillum parvum TaxID=83401 RepID=A0A1G8D282_9PROT|nr:hypothetical protein [Roseospirillum parvum]SDH51846.1 hypothetical protein SAMN05421742_107160 [Roseospirillum parvum]
MIKASLAATAVLALGACAVPGTHVLESGDGRVVATYVEPSGRPTATAGIAAYCADRGQQPVVISDVPTKRPINSHVDWRQRTVQCQNPPAEG